jgi:tRNA dimethylallyltransferase
MIKNGLLKELTTLLDNGLTFEMQSMQSIGYKEFKDYFVNGAPLEKTIDTVKRHTRNYAKRQITWFKRYKDILWFDSYDVRAYRDIENSIINRLQLTNNL